MRGRGFREERGNRADDNGSGTGRERTLREREREWERESSKGECLKEISISLSLVIKKLDFAIWSEIRSC